MEWVYSLIEGSAFPIITAFVLGLLTIISPCPFCSDITAVGYIGKDVRSRGVILRNGFSYALGKIVTYWGLSFIFILGGDIAPVQHFLEEYGERFLGPFFIVCALLILIFSLLETHHHECHCGEAEHHHHDHHHHSKWLEKVAHAVPENSGIGAFVIGLIGSLAFCPYTGVLYFGVLIPLTVSEPVVWSWSLPLAFALATALPVLLITSLFAYGLTSISRINAHIHQLERILRILCITIFMGIGLYLTVSVWSGHHHHDHHHHEPIELTSNP